jgi:hypothetical protein
MNSIPWFSDLKDLSGVELSFLVVVTIIATLVTGFVIDVIIQGSGLGPFLNGILALIGVCGGIYLRYQLFAPFRADDLVLTIGMAIATAFILIFALVVAKSRLL